MSILNFERSQIVAFAENGLMNKKSVLHYDVCQALKNGLTHEKIAELFNLNDGRMVRYIKEHKCPECR